MRGTVVCAVGLAMWVMAVNAVGSVDVRIQVIPLQNSSGVSNVRTVLPTLHAEVQPGSPYVLEVWLSDVGALNTGIVAAYVDLAYDTAWTDAKSLKHGDLFTSFRAGAIQDASGWVENFGAGRFVPAPPPPPGIEPEWVRLGWVNMAAGTPLTGQPIHLAAQVGLGGIGVYDRLVDAGDVEIIAHDYRISPEPSALALLATGCLLAGRRRRSPRHRLSGRGSDRGRRSGTTSVSLSFGGGSDHEAQFPCPRGDPDPRTGCRVRPSPTVQH